MKELIKKIINKLNIPEIDFADVRFTKTDNEGIFFERGSLKSVSSSIGNTAIGIRVLINGTWGFAASSKVDESVVDKLIKNAMESAKEGSRFKWDKIKYKVVSPTIISYEFKPKEDPFEMDIEEKVNFVGNIAKKLTQNPKIVHSYAAVNFYRQYKMYANTEGTFVDTLLYDTSPVMFVMAAGKNGVQTRTFPGHMPGQRGGFEVLKKYRFEENSEKIVKEAVDLLDAPTVTEKKSDIIIVGGHLALQLHESVGHATEADRIFGMEISYAGKTFIKPEMIGDFRYGSDILNIYTDSSDKRAIGYNPVDDEGIPARRVDLIKNGKLVDLQTSRFTADKLGLKPSSNMKASDASDVPLIRMTNICIEPGEGTLKDLIKDTENGYLLDFTKTWSIDDNRNNFQFTTEIGWKIENGEIKHIVKEPTYYGITSEFWRSCDRICGPEEWNFYGTFNCGKGEPGQIMHLSHGVSPARFKNISMLPKE